MLVFPSLKNWCLVGLCTTHSSKWARGGVPQTAGGTAMEKHILLMYYIQRHSLGVRLIGVDVSVNGGLSLCLASD